MLWIGVEGVAAVPVVVIVALENLSVVAMRGGIIVLLLVAADDDCWRFEDLLETRLGDGARVDEELPSG